MVRPEDIDQQDRHLNGQHNPQHLNGSEIRNGLNQNGHGNFSDGEHQCAAEHILHQNGESTNNDNRPLHYLPLNDQQHQPHHFGIVSVEEINHIAQRGSNNGSKPTQVEQPQLQPSLQLPEIQLPEAPLFCSLRGLGFTLATAPSSINSCCQTAPLSRGPLDPAIYTMDYYVCAKKGALAEKTDHNLPTSQTVNSTLGAVSGHFSEDTDSEDERAGGPQKPALPLPTELDSQTKKCLPPPTDANDAFLRTITQPGERVLSKDGNHYVKLSKVDSKNDESNFDASQLYQNFTPMDEPYEPEFPSDRPASSRLRPFPYLAPTKFGLRTPRCTAAYGIETNVNYETCKRGLICFEEAFYGEYANKQLTESFQNETVSEKIGDLGWNFQMLNPWQLVQRYEDGEKTTTTASTTVNLTRKKKKPKLKKNPSSIDLEESSTNSGCEEGPRCLTSNQELVDESSLRLAAFCHFQPLSLPTIRCWDCGTFQKAGTFVKHIWSHLWHENAVARHKHWCYHCCRYFASDKELMDHFMMINRFGRYFCMICVQNFDTDDERMEHMRETHMKLETPFACSLCPYRATTAWQFLDHYELFHPLPICTLCLHVFNSAESMYTSSFRNSYDRQLDGYRLQGEIKLHLGEHLAVGDTFACQSCSLTFANAFDYAIHRKGYHSNVSLNLVKRTLVTRGMKTDPMIMPYESLEYLAFYRDDPILERRMGNLVKPVKIPSEPKFAVKFSVDYLERIGERASDRRMNLAPLSLPSTPNSQSSGDALSPEEEIPMMLQEEENVLLNVVEEKRNVEQEISMTQEIVPESIGNEIPAKEVNFRGFPKLRRSPWTLNTSNSSKKRLLQTIMKIAQEDYRANVSCTSKPAFDHRSWLRNFKVKMKKWIEIQRSSGQHPRKRRRKKKGKHLLRGRLPVDPKIPLNVEPREETLKKEMYVEEPIPWLPCKEKDQAEECLSSELQSLCLTADTVARFGSNTKVSQLFGLLSNGSECDECGNGVEEPAWDQESHYSVELLWCGERGCTVKSFCYQTMADHRMGHTKKEEVERRLRETDQDYRQERAEPEAIVSEPECFVFICFHCMQYFEDYDAFSNHGRHRGHILYLDTFSEELREYEQRIAQRETGIEQGAAIVPPKDQESEIPTATAIIEMPRTDASDETSEERQPKTRGRRKRSKY